MTRFHRFILHREDVDQCKLDRELLGAYTAQAQAQEFFKTVKGKSIVENLRRVNAPHLMGQRTIHQGHIYHLQWKLPGSLV